MRTIKIIDNSLDWLLPNDKDFVRAVSQDFKRWSVEYQLKRPRKAGFGYSDYYRWTGFKCFWTRQQAREFAKKHRGY